MYNRVTVYFTLYAASAPVWMFIGPRPGRVRLRHGLRMLCLGLIVIPNTLLGAVITFNGSLLYEAYAEVEQPFNLSLMTDQQLGGLLLWLPGDMMSIIAAGILMVMWYQHEEAKDQLDVTSVKEKRLEPDREHTCWNYGWLKKIHEPVPKLINMI